MNGKSRIPSHIMARYNQIIEGGRSIGKSGRELRRWATREFKRWPEYDEMIKTVPMTTMEAEDVEQEF